MKLLYIGAESSNWIINLCNEFCKQGHEVTCVVQNADEYDKENPIETHKNLKRIDIEYGRFFEPMHVFNKLLVDLQTNKYDIVFGSHAPISPVVKSIAEKFGIPWGIMILDIPTDLMKSDRKRMRNWLFWFDTMKYADHIIFNTFIARDEYEKFTGQYFPDENVIPYAINTMEEYDMSGLDINGDYILSICRLTPTKSCRAIAYALSLLNKPLKYIAVGRDCGELQLIKTVCEQNNIEFEHKNMVSEKEKFNLIKNSAVVVYPQQSEYIGGLSPFEAMYCGKPVIVGNYKVLQDLYGENSRYFDNSATDLAKEIVYLHNIKKDIIKSKLEDANAYCKQIATFNVMAGQMLNIFKKTRR